jgi:hypothetical protein
MEDTIKVIKSEFNNFTFERAYVVGERPIGVISGTICNLYSKPYLLAAGLAYCQPLDETLTEKWPVYTEVEVNGVAKRWWHITTDPATVNAARKLMAQLAAL